MTRLFLIATFLYSSSIIFGQSVSWLHVYENFSTPSHFNQVRNGDFLVSGNFLARHTAEGELLWLRENWGETDIIFSYEMETGDLISIFSSGEVYKTSSEGMSPNLLFQLNSGIEFDRFYIRGALKLEEQLYILAKDEEAGISGTRLYVFDLNTLELLNSSFLSNLFFGDLAFLADGTLIMSGGKNVVRLTIDGTILWETTLPEEYIIMATLIKNDRIYLAGQKVHNAYLGIIDIDGAIVLSQEYEPSDESHLGRRGFRSIALLPNGDIICGGFDGRQVFRLKGPSTISCITNSGTIKWQVEQSIGTGAIVYALFVEEDNRLVAGGLGGITDYYVAQRAFLFGLEELTSISPLANPSLRVYPNPTQDYLHLEGLNITTSYQFEIFDAQSKLLRRYNSLIPAYVGDLAAGIYFLKLSDGEQHQVLKWVKG